MKILTPDAENFLIRVTLAHLIKTFGGQVIVPFDLDAYIQNEPLSLIDENLIYAATKDIFRFEKIEGGYTVTQGNIPLPKEKEA